MDVLQGYAGAACSGGEHQLVSALELPPGLFIAVEQSFAKQFRIQRFWQVAFGVHPVALHGHLPVRGDEYHVRSVRILFQHGGQRHAVQLSHEHVQQQKVKMPAGLNV